MTCMVKRKDDFKVDNEDIGRDNDITPDQAKPINLISL
jgi:hypothetical protein